MATRRNPFTVVRGPQEVWPGPEHDRLVSLAALGWLPSSRLDQLIRALAHRPAELQEAA
jgi:hypothetical protein